MAHATRIVLALLVVLTIYTPASPQPARMKIVLDTDIGTDIDDAWALGYALKSPAFELLGITVTDADTPKRARLACKLLHRLGRTDAPVAVGRQTPAVPADRIDYQFTWAEDFEAFKPIATSAVISSRRSSGDTRTRSRSSPLGPFRTSAISCDCTPTWSGS